VEKIVLKVLVTGASGFVAEYLIPLLRAQGIKVLGLDRKSSPSAICDEFFISDLNEIDSDDFCSNCKFGGIIHLAAARADWGISDEEFERDNIQATSKVVQLAKISEAKQLIFVSSISVFGQGRGTILREENQPNPINVYGRTKLAAENLVRSCSDFLDVVIVRPTVIYGPSNPENTGFYRATDNNIFRMIDAVQRNRFVIPGDRSVIKSVCYVENIARFLAFLAQNQTKTTCHGVLHRYLSSCSHGSTATSDRAIGH
jgi:nucleoside-diphosphate-sugar epimerase